MLRIGSYSKQAAFGLIMILAACTASPGFTGLGTEKLQNTVQFVMGKLSQMWVAPQDSLVMTQRRVGGDLEQLIALRNDTTLQGDNFIWARISGHRNTRFQLDGMLARYGSVPYPFKGVNDQNLHSGKDAVGEYFWLEKTSGVNTTCVLAFRRLSPAQRVLPGNANEMELLMRNCVQGTVKQALAPLMDGQIGYSVLTSPNAPQGGNRMLSPLAAPQ